MSACQSATITYGDGGQYFSIVKKVGIRCYVTGPKVNSTATVTCTMPQSMLSTVFSQISRSSPERPYLKGFSSMMTFLWGTGGLPVSVLTGYSCTK